MWPDSDTKTVNHLKKAPVNYLSVDYSSAGPAHQCEAGGPASECVTLH